MPTYQYACTECGERLEAVQSFSDPALIECPACSGRLRKVFSAVGVVFKGSGFYKNDSRAPAKSGAGTANSDGASGDSGGGAKSGAPSSSGAAASPAPSGSGSGSGSASGSGSGSGSGSSTASAPAAKTA